MDTMHVGILTADFMRDFADDADAPPYTTVLMYNDGRGYRQRVFYLDNLADLHRLIADVRDAGKLGDIRVDCGLSEDRDALYDAITDAAPFSVN